MAPKKQFKEVNLIMKKNKKENKTNKRENKQDQTPERNEDKNYIGETLHRNTNNNRDERLVIDGDPKEGYSPHYKGQQSLTGREINHLNKKINNII